jgi:hypothetical protein
MNKMEQKKMRRLKRLAKKTNQKIVKTPTLVQVGTAVHHSASPSTESVFNKNAWGVTNG